MKDSRFIIGRWIAAVLVMLGISFAVYQVAKDNMPKAEVRKIEGYQPWSDEVLLLAESLPIQDGGRIKPLSAYAGFAMYGLHGARSMEVDTGDGKVVKIKPTAWILDLLFRPQFAIHEPTFRVDNSAALEAIGVSVRSKRDRYSYEEIEGGRDKLTELSQTYQTIDSKERDPVQNQIVDLASNMMEYENLLGYFTFARSGVVLEGFGQNGDNKRADMSAIMTTAPQLLDHIRGAQAHGTEMNSKLRGMLEQVLDASNFAKFGLFLMPPADKDQSKWASAGETIMDVMSGSNKNATSAIDDISILEGLARSADDQKVFAKQLVLVKERFVGRAKARGQYERVELEAKYYRKDLFLYALVCFMMGSLSALAMWVTGRSLIGRILFWLTAVLSGSGLIYCVTAIVTRCVIMQRPPIGNLYDTVIFITTAVVLISFVIEALTRRRFALGIGPIVATALVLLARRYEVGDAKDHMDPLVAVLNSNYWLTTHVITITLGYSAGLSSAFLSAAYVLMRGLGLDRGDKEFRNVLTRAVYGMLCFTLFLALIGTVLGGIWANDSWGRFWGWDPKENGALLIVLWALAILHARLGGYLRGAGLHFASLFTAIVVTFSWWHVNFLGVGLHNYGFTSGKSTIWVFYSAILALMAFGAVALAIEKSTTKEQ